MMNPPRKPTRTEQTQKFFALHHEVVILIVGIVIGAILRSF